MAIVKCVCGFSKLVEDKLVGKKASCPKCKKPIIVVAEEVATPTQHHVENEAGNQQFNSIQADKVVSLHWRDRKIPKFSAIIIIVLLTLLSFTSVLDKRNDHYFDNALKQAASSFAISKTLNAVVSVVQDIDMTFEPMGVGVSVGAGEALDPVNDIIEKFSYVMFASTLSLGVQKIFSEVGRCGFVKAVLGIVSVLLVLSLVVETIPARDTACSTFTKIFIIFVVLRFAMPIVSTINKQVYDSVIQQNMAIEEDKLTILADEISSMDIVSLPEKSVNDTAGRENGQIVEKSATTKTPEPSTEKNGFIGSVGGMWSAAVERTGNAYGDATDSMSRNWNNLKSKANPYEMKEKIDALTKKISEASTYLVNLAVIFVFQTIISPLIVLWGIIKMTGYLVGSKPL